MAKIDIAVVGNQRLVSSGLKSLMENSFSYFKVVDVIGDVKDLNQKVKRENSPKIFLVDVNNTSRTGYDNASWLRFHYPDTNIVILADLHCEDVVLKFIELGIKGYLLKDAEPEDFKRALEVVAAGGRYFPECITDYLIKSLSRQSTKPNHVRLSQREIEFLRLTGTELTYKEIAAKLCVSARTVDGYRDHLFEKLQVKSRVGLVLYAIRNNFLEV
jgi:DNA-binding NarL/FixJ family response regulator